MKTTLAYQGRSALEGGRQPRLRLAANRAREPVAFHAELRQPMRFREAISALHDVVATDLRFHRGDKTAYEQWKMDRQAQREGLRYALMQRLRAEWLAGAVERQQLAAEHADHCRSYWRARDDYRQQLIDENRLLLQGMRLAGQVGKLVVEEVATQVVEQAAVAALAAVFGSSATLSVVAWGIGLVLDPVCTVADDAVLFECFSKDESVYGCLSVTRDAFATVGGVQMGTTNIDYSEELYQQFQRLRSYRPTRFLLDPGGAEVRTGDQLDHREQKIDLPDSWLRGFLQLQAGMGLPMRRVRLSRDAVYATLAYLKRRRARTSPRALRLELFPGQHPRIILEPWERQIVDYGSTPLPESYEPATVRIWGRQRLLVLQRVLPLTDYVDVYLLGSGLPSFWVAHMGDMHLTIGLSGWTTNDWTRSAALDLLAPPVAPTREQVDAVANHLHQVRGDIFGSLDSLNYRNKPPAGDHRLTAAALRQLALTGQVIHDLPSGLYRWRPILDQPVPRAVSEYVHPELQAARELFAGPRNGIVIGEREVSVKGVTANGTVARCKVRLVLDRDGAIVMGTCVCSHYRRFRLKKGPCRHMLAMRLRWDSENPPQQG